MRDLNSQAIQNAIHDWAMDIWTKKVYWQSPLNDVDDFGDRFADTMIDGKTNMGPWANMTPRSWAMHGVGQFGVGLGQLYRKQTDGRWLKIKG